MDGLQTTGPGYKAENQFVTEEAKISPRCRGRPASPASEAPAATGRSSPPTARSLLGRQDPSSPALFPDCCCQQVPASASHFPVVAPSQMLNFKCSEK